MRVPIMSKFKYEDYDKRLYEVRDLGEATPIPEIKIDFKNMKSNKKEMYVKRVKDIIHASIEYKNFVKFLKEKLDMNCCTFFNEINLNKRNIKLEMHHIPFTITDLINIAIEYFIQNDIELNDLEIAEFVMLWHYTGLVGVLPLSKTVHTLYHDGQIFIPLTYPFGNVIGFYNEYKDYMTNTLRTKFKKLVDKTKEFNNEPPEVLRKRFVYLKINGMELPKTI